jgi:hypothetical protein
MEQRKYNKALLTSPKMGAVLRKEKELERGELKSRCFQRKKVEVQIKALMINAMIDAVA